MRWVDHTGDIALSGSEERSNFVHSYVISPRSKLFNIIQTIAWNMSYLVPFCRWQCKLQNGTRYGKIHPLVWKIFQNFDRGRNYVPLCGRNYDYGEIACIVNAGRNYVKMTSIFRTHETASSFDLSAKIFNFPLIMCSRDVECIEITLRMMPTSIQPSYFHDLP